MPGRDNNIGEIIIAFKKKDAYAHMYIYKMYYKGLTYFAEKLLGTKEQAFLIVADSFMKLWAKHAEFDSLPAIKSFLFQSIRNSCLNFLKHSKKVSDSQRDYRYWYGKEDLMLHILYEAELLSEDRGDVKILSQASCSLYG